MSFNLNSLWLDWRAKVPDGTPNPSNDYHLVLLKELCLEKGIDKDTTDSVILFLEKKEKTGYTHKSRGIYVKDADADNPNAQRYKKVGDKFVKVDKKDKVVKKGKPKGVGVFDTPTVKKAPPLALKKAKKKKPLKYNAQGRVIKDRDEYGKVIATRDKTLKKVNSQVEKEVFESDLGPDDDNTFKKKNKNFKVGKKTKNISNPPPPFKFDPKLMNAVPKVPKKYLQMIERMIDTQQADSDGFLPSISHFVDEKGAGRISAQGGEIMALAVAGMDDEQVKLFQESINKHLADPNRPKKQIIEKSWVEAAVNNRKAMYNNIKRQYPNINLPDDIVHTGWDTKKDVEAMGLSDYKKNKGFSTDMYLSINTPNGVMLGEVSLKKDKNVNFLNSGTGKFSEWNPNLSDNINPKVYAKKARERNINFITNNKTKLANLLKKQPQSEATQEFISKMESKYKKMGQKPPYNIDHALTLFGGRSSRDKQAVLWYGIVALADDGNKDAITLMKNDEKEHNDYVSDSITAITKKPVKRNKMYQGMLKEIKSEFPLKAVSSEEESMAIGDQSLDKATMKAIFGTDDYNEIKDHLVAKEPKPVLDTRKTIKQNGKVIKNPNYKKLERDTRKTIKQNGKVINNPNFGKLTGKMTEPYLGYQAKARGKIIPISTIVIREDGRGYGGQFKFEMKLDKRFYKLMETANKDTYGE